MAQREITVENMTSEEHKKLDRKANIALLVVLVMFCFGVLFIHTLFKKMQRNQTSNYANQHHQNGAANQPGSNTGISQPELDRLTAEGKYAEAQKKVESVLSTTPNDFNANLSLGLLYQKQGSLGKARKYLEKAVRLNPPDTYCCQALGQLYQITEPVKAVDYYKGLVSDKTYAVDFSVDLLQSQIRAAVVSEKSDRKIQFLKDAKNTEDEISRKYEKNVSSINLLKAERAYFEGDFGKSAAILGEMTFNNTDNLKYVDKYAALVLLGLLQLNEKNSAKSEESFSQYGKMLENWQEPVFDRYLPRAEQLFIFRRILLNKSMDVESLKKNAEQLKHLDGMGIIPADGAQEIRSLSIEMFEAEKKGDYNGAIKAALELRKVLADYRCLFVDEDVSIPVFISCLEIYIGDLYKSVENNKKASEHYKQALNGFPAVKKIAEERLAKL